MNIITKEKKTKTENNIFEEKKRNTDKIQHSKWQEHRREDRNNISNLRVNLRLKMKNIKSKNITLKRHN